jgi:hypothetical protein
MLDLDALKQNWAELDRKLDVNIRLNRQLLSAAKLGKAQSALTRLAIFVAVEAAMWLAIIIALGNFIYEHIAVPHFAVSAIAVDIYAIGMLHCLIRQIVISRRIDYGQPITAIQKQIEALRVLRIRTVQWSVLVGLAVWVPAMIVIFKAALGLNIYEPHWVWSNIAFGLAMIPLAVWVSQRFGERMDRSPFIQGVMRSLAGYNLTAAANFVASLSRFESENDGRRA